MNVRGNEMIAIPNMDKPKDELEQTESEGER